MLAGIFRAYLTGAIVGALAALVETAASFPLSAEKLAAYTLLAGSLAALARGATGALWSGRAGRAAALASAGFFALMHGLYFVNVGLLPSEHYLSAKSLLADAALALPVMALLVWAATLPPLGPAHWRGGSAAVGGALLVTAAGLLYVRWPDTPPLPSRSGDGPNLLLIVIDSARRDHLSAYGYERPTSPSLLRAAEKARVYERAYAASSWTVPTMTEMLLAGRDGAPTLARRLAARGYVTGCFTDNPHLFAGSALLSGFDRVGRSVGRWRRLVRGSVLGEMVDRLDRGDDSRLVERAFNFMRHVQGPAFLYVHLMDSHTPYDAAPIDGRRRPGRLIQFPRSGMRLTAEEAEDIVARFDGGLRDADAAAGRLLAAADGWGRPYLAIVTADHGESLGEDGRWFHGGSLAPELLAVPLLVRGTGVEPGRVRAAVGHASIAYTLLAVAGASCADCRASDLRTSAGDAVVEGGLPSSLRYRIVDGHKLVLDASGRRTLFDLEQDPGERHDLAAARAALASRLAAGLGEPAADSPQAGDVERLRALGYTQ